MVAIEAAFCTEGRTIVSRRMGLAGLYTRVQDIPTKIFGTQNGLAGALLSLPPLLTGGLHSGPASEQPRSLSTTVSNSLVFRGSHCVFPSLSIRLAADTG